MDENGYFRPRPGAWEYKLKDRKDFVPIENLDLDNVYAYDEGSWYNCIKFCPNGRFYKCGLDKALTLRDLNPLTTLTKGYYYSSDGKTIELEYYSPLDIRYGAPTRYHLTFELSESGDSLIYKTGNYYYEDKSTFIRIDLPVSLQKKYKISW